MRELSLFSGAGGGLLATKHLLGWTTVGYVEIDDYCQRVIAQRIEDGYLDRAPIFGDIRAFLSDGYAERYRGMVDVVTGGFPCQPFSLAGKQLGSDDPRNMWPATIECIRMVRPKHIFMENSSALLTNEYFGTVLSDLASCGIDVCWKVLSAAELGAPHLRDRVWITSYSGGVRRQGFRQNSERAWSQQKFEGLVQRSLQLCIPAGKLRRISDGVAHRVDRLRATGNGQVPRVAATAWRLLSGEINAMRSGE